MKKVIPNDAVLVPDAAKLAFQGTIFSVHQWQQELFDGSFDTFEMLKRPDTTSVICIVNDKLIVLDEEQPNSGRRRSFPGGRIDPEDVDVISAAKREVLEETGYVFANWKLVKVLQPIKKMEWFIHYVVAWGVMGQQETAHEPGEKISVEYVTLGELHALAAKKVGFLGEVAELFADCSSVDELAAIATFAGREVDR